MIEIVNLCKTYKSKKGQSTQALNNINLKTNNKGMVFIVGTSGSGKSTLLNILGGLDTADSGIIKINNKDISKLNKSEYDGYRNSYIGFIFQEFNVLENLSVYENIEISLKLQNVKDTNKSVESILIKLGLGELKKRRMNELSGGQKQRVAIARALIKNPNIILADEPTGNLDSKNSEQIFKILKEISENRLVVVVSHDEVAAKKYGDQIICIEDGKVIKNNYKKEESIKNNNNTEFIGSNLPTAYKIKLARCNMNKKPFKLIMTIVLLTISFIFMTFTINIALFDKNKFLINTMKDNNNYNYQIEKVSYEADGSRDFIVLNEEDLKYVEKTVGKELNVIYKLLNNNKYLEFEFGEFQKNNAFFFQELNNVSFIELKDNNIVGDVIGEFPDSDREILVHKYFADYIMEYGVKLFDDSLYIPSSYNEIINDKKEIKLGDNKVYISGIVDDDLSTLNYYKKIRYSDWLKEEDKKYSQLCHIYGELNSRVYVNGLTKSIKLNNDKSKLNEDTLVSYNNKYLSSVKFIDKDIKILTKDGVKKINSLKDNEIVISYNELSKLSKTYSSELNEYVIKNKKETYEVLEKKFIYEYIKNHSLNYFLNMYIYTKDGYHVDTKLKVIGYSLDDESYISKKYYDDYKPLDKKATSIILNEKNINKLEKIFSQFKYYEESAEETESGDYYCYYINAGARYDIEDVIIMANNSLIFVGVVSLVFTLFALLLFINFISVTIMYAKKEIGILKALGTKNSDIVKIFGYESLLMAVASFVLSLISVYLLFGVINNYSYGNWVFKVRGLFLNPMAVLSTFAFSIAVALVVTSILINRIVKIKPIDVILDK